MSPGRSNSPRGALDDAGAAPRSSATSSKNRSSSSRSRGSRESTRIQDLLNAWWARPLHDFQTIVGVTLVLVIFGLMMVLSSSSVEALLNLGSPYARFLPQALYSLAGLVAFVVVVRLPTSLLRRGAPWLMGAAFALLILVLVPGIGSEVYGAQSWIFIGSVSFQPSEIAKVALVIWTCHMVATASERHVDVSRMLRPIGLCSGAVLAMVVLQRDLGTAVTIAIIVMAVLWFGQFHTRIFAAMAIGGALAVAVFTATVGYRSDRIRAFLNPDLDPQGLNYQATQAKYALANGGMFGKGLGQSDAKWSYLPQAYNDFIFAVVGEELGAIGALAVIGLFAMVLWIGLRIAMRSTDPFLRMLSAVATVWIVVQACINIGYVVGLLPVTGLQLPLISAGGTSMLTTLAMFGLIAHAAYREPEALISLGSNTSNPLLTRIFGHPRNRPQANTGPRKKAKSSRGTSAGSARAAATPRRRRPTDDTQADRSPSTTRTRERQPRAGREAAPTRRRPRTARQ